MNAWNSFFDQFIFHPSGGLVYHSRALRYSEKYWKNHLKHVKNFLMRWNPSITSILLVGPSAGYSLPVEWVRKFKAVKAIEPDPFARKLFEMRFKIKPEWITTMIDFELHSPDTEAVLFCNVLGQMEIKSEVQFALNLRQFCEGKSWASYHDVLSGKNIRWKSESTSAHQKLTVEQLKSGIQVRRSQTTVQVNAHPAYELFPASDQECFEYWEWRLTPSQTQVIEGVFKNNFLED